MAPTTLLLPALKRIASPNYSSRGGTKIDLVVLHDCEGGYAGSIDWFTKPASKVSAHIVLRDDGLEATQMVAFANKAWHVCNFNPRSIGIEMAGFAAKGFGGPEWHVAASIVAYLLHQYDIPCHWARRGSGPGFCSHFDLGVAGGGHKDPTTDPDVWSAFIDMVINAYAQPLPSGWSDGLAPPVSGPATFTPSGTTRHDLVKGSVEWAQMQLNATGISKPLLNVDGLMGPKTAQAAALFQKAHNLSVTGDLDAKTVAALSAAA